MKDVGKATAHQAVNTASEFSCSGEAVIGAGAGEAYNGSTVTGSHGGSEGWGVTYGCTKAAGKQRVVSKGQGEDGGDVHGVGRTLTTVSWAMPEAII